MRHDAEWVRERFATAQVARLATASTESSPHLVPITFALVGSTLVSAIDWKPKSGRTLRRLDNIGANPFVSLLVDEYAEDWAQLWWARVDGWGRVLPVEDVPEFDALVAKYQQYHRNRPVGPVIVVAIDHWAGWSAS